MEDRLRKEIAGKLITITKLMSRMRAPTFTAYMAQADNIIPLVRTDCQREIGVFLETQCKDMDDLIRKLKLGTFKANPTSKVEENGN